MTPRIYYTGHLASSAVIILDEPNSRHLLKALRLKIGEPLKIFNGHGGEYSAVLHAVQKQNAVVKVGEWIAADCESPLKIYLGQTISRGERMDYAVQKSVELGVHRITPVVTARCGVQLNQERAVNRAQHWQKVAVSAAEQSGRCYVPPVSEPQSFSAFLSQASGLRLICAPGKKSEIQNRPADLNITLLIGPEGGFTEEELQQAETAGFQPFYLGSRILRTETAPIAAITLLQNRWGDLA